MESRYSIIEQIVEIERKLVSTKFTKLGYIYFKEDMLDGEALATTPPLCSSVLKRFVLGPFVESG